MDNQALAVLVAMTLFGAMAAGMIASQYGHTGQAPAAVIGYLPFSPERNAVTSD